MTMSAVKCTKFHITVELRFTLYKLYIFQACSSEVMMFRMARRYDVQSDSILFANNQPYTRDSYSLAGMGETIEDMLRFCRQMYAMKVDNAEYALLTAIVIFSGE